MQTVLSVCAVAAALLSTSSEAFSTSSQQHQQQHPSSKAVTSRQEFFTQNILATASAVVLVGTTAGASPAHARGRATLEQSYERYAPRIKAGGEFYAKDVKQLVVTADWKGLQNALQEPPQRVKADLQKADAGVAERARQAGGFSDARVLVAADLFAASFSENAISPKTKKMQGAVNKVRGVLGELQTVAKQASGEAGGGLFGLGGKKPDQAALAKKAKELYIEGGNAWNEYVLAANDSLALKFDRFDFVQ